MNLIEEIPNRLAENAAFLWLLHDQALSSPDYNVDELVELESRIDAQLDGLLAYGEDGWKACEEALRFEEPGEIFAAAVIAFSKGDAQQLKQVVEIGCQTQDNFKALLSALTWLPFDSVKGWIGKLMYADNPAYACLGISACALHRANCGDALTKAIANPKMSAATEYFAQIMKAAGLMQRKDVSAELAVYQGDEEPWLVLSSVYYACILGDKSNMSHLKTMMFSNPDFAEQAIELVFRALPLSEAKSWLSEMSKLPAMQRVLIKALGILGDSSYLPWLVEQMENEDVARLAANSFSKIFGIDIDKEQLSISPSLSEEDDEDVADSNLPIPDKVKIARWYAANANKLSPGRRYLAGQELTVDSCLSLMQQGVQSQRRDAYAELLINYPGQHVNENRRRLRV